MRKVAFYTLGCKVNQYETEAMRELFVNRGDQVVDSDSSADIYVINTCTVTGMSDKKSRQIIRRLKRLNPEAVIAVVGCYSQIAPAEVMAIEGVNLVMGTHQRSRILDYLEGLDSTDRREVVTDIGKIREFEEMTVDRIEGRTRAFVKIQDGCDRYCSYCIIPYARGPVRSREADRVVEEVKRLAGKGFAEVVLTGIHVASYGKDLKETTLLELINRINSLEGIHRIRLSSLEPTLMTEEFARSLSSNDKLCPHFHLSLQSGCDTVLQRMNRKYTTARYREAVGCIRAYWPDAAITTDIIVGFPGETEKEFEETCRFVAEIGFAQVHVFNYSTREGTPAAVMSGQVPSEIRQVRVEQLIGITDKLSVEYLKRFIGQTMRVIVEKNDVKTPCSEGLTDNYLRVVLKNELLEVGSEEVVLIVEICDNVLKGCVAKNVTEVKGQ